MIEAMLRGACSLNSSVKRTLTQLLLLYDAIVLSLRHNISLSSVADAMYKMASREALIAFSHPQGLQEQ